MSATEVGYQASSATDTLVAKPSKKTAEFRIVLPDQSVYWFELQRNCTGQDLVDQMCDILGIVEKDYFSLQYVERSTGCNVWLNKRLKVKEQYKGAGSPYNLKFAVRYYTDAELLLQPTTIDAFYKDLKYQIRRGEIQVPDGKKSGIGALLAQVEFGDIEKTESSPMFVYPPYFPEQQWNDGISYQIAKEHKKLKGINKKDAQLLFIRGMYETELYGVTQVPAILADGQNVVLAVGARCIRMYNSRGTIIRKIPYHVLCQIAFALRFFTLSYQTRNEDNQLIEKRMKCILPCRTVAKSIFRTIAEEQVFFYQETVTEKIRNHADNSFRRWKKFYHKMFKKQFKPKYYYDIERTKIEAYRHCWQLLHQVSGAVNAGSETEVPIPHPNSLNYIINMNLSNDSDEEDDGHNSRTKSEVCWGLSKSSCNLAKELLSAPQLSLTESEENLLVFTKVESKRSSSSQEYEEEGEKTADESDSLDKAEPLSGAQGKKLRRLLLKIQDERLCTVCMDELISSVFCPCGHYVACNKCSKRLDRCPVCRQAVGYVQHVYTRF